MREMKDSGLPWLGMVPTTWNYIKLKTYYAFEKGKNAQKYTVDYVGQNEGYYPVYSGQTENNGIMGMIDTFDYDVDECLFSTTVGAKVMTPRVLSGKFSLSQNCLIMKQIKSCNNHYMYYYLHPLFDYEKGSIPSYMQPSLRVDDLKKYGFYIPQISEQEKIANFLDTKCSEIDFLSSDIQSEIEILEAYKSSVITEAVTKGLDKNVPMKDSGISWIGNIPKHWSMYRIADLYCDRNERGSEELSVLTVSINSGVSDKELSDEDQERVFVRSEDKTKYKRVYPGDITYNMMRAWQGAFGAVRVNGMVSPAYVVAKQTGKVQIDSRYIEALLRSPMGIEEMNRYSYGIMDFRKRLYWPQFRIIKVCLPDIQEQKRIADYIDEKSKEIDEIIGQKQEQLEVLADYKKSVIYEYVTGKKEIPVA